MTYWLTRLYYIRGLGLLYLIAGAILWLQGPALFGPDGLEPLQGYATVNLENLKQAILNQPSLLLFFKSNGFIQSMAALMMILSVPMIFGYCNIIVVLLLWFCQLSLVNSGSTFYSFGWETLLCEMTFFTFFIVHPWRFNLLGLKNFHAGYVSFIPLFWLMFRLMFGAGMIKIRGDQCWTDLTCLNFHYETQPNPHWLSWYYHQMPITVHKASVLFNHFCELVVPFLFLLWRNMRWWAGIFIVIFQITLITTGNLAFINLQTIVLALIAFDDRTWEFITSLKIKARIKLLNDHPSSRFRIAVMSLVIVGTGVLSVKPIQNLLSPQQRMNQSYNPYHVGNSYGLFGSITRRRLEVVLSGSTDNKPTTWSVWKEYDFHCKPSDPLKKPCWITPYHLRLDWQMWFLAMRPRVQEVWVMRLLEKALLNHPDLEKLWIRNPFKDGEPPQFVKLDLYHYEWWEPDDEEMSREVNTPWWRRKLIRTYLSPVNLGAVQSALK